MSKELKKFKKKVRIVRKQTQKFCMQCILSCSLVALVYVSQSNEQNIEDFKPAATQVVTY